MGSGHDPDPLPDPEGSRALSSLDDVRRELARLGSDASSAPEVPPAVTARVGAALRAAPHPRGVSRAHALSRPKLTRTQTAGLMLGITAAGVAVVVGAMTLTRAPRAEFPAGPTASRITVAAPTQTFPLTDTELRAALTAAPDLGPLSDPRRRASCLAGLGYQPDLVVLGGRPLSVTDRPGVLLLLPGPTAGQVAAVAVEPTCSAANTGLLAETVVSRP